MVTEERSNFQWVLRMPQEVRRITNHYEEENLSDVAIGEITEGSTQSQLKLTMQSGKCMSM